jgi:hypothetical protein
MSKLLKILGYGYAIHYNDHREKFEVYKLGEWSPGAEITDETKVVLHERLKKTIMLI